MDHVALMLTLDSSSFVVAHSRWWTTTSAPTLRGTFEGTPASAVKVVIDDREIAATLVGDTWSVTLPEHSIDGASTVVTIVMTDPRGGALEQELSLALDPTQP